MGDLLELDLDLVEVEPEDHYNIAGVYGFGRGVFARGPISGADTSYKRLNRVHTNLMVLSRLKAFEGAVSVIPKEFDGWYLSPEFPTFRCLDGELDPRFLANVCRWRGFWSLLAEASTGIGARRERVHPERLLKLRLQVPDIHEQRRIARDLDRLWAVGQRLGALSQHAQQLSEALSVSACGRPDIAAASKSASGWRRVELGSVMAPALDGVTVEADRNYPNLGIFSFGRGVFEKPMIDGGSSSAKTLYRVRAGQFIYSRLFAFEGAYAFVAPNFDGYFVSNEFPTFDPDPEQLDARWLASYLRSASHWSELAGSSKGLGVRRQRISVQAILGYRVWLPPIDQQRSMVAVLERLESAQAVRREAQARIDSLVPAALNRAFAGVS